MQVREINVQRGHLLRYMQEDAIFLNLEFHLSYETVAAIAALILITIYKTPAKF